MRRRRAARSGRRRDASFVQTARVVGLCALRDSASVGLVANVLMPVGGACACLPVVAEFVVDAQNVVEEFVASQRASTPNGSAPASLTAPPPSTAAALLGDAAAAFSLVGIAVSGARAHGLSDEP